MRTSMVVVLLGLALAGCKTSGDIRARHIEQKAMSARSVQDIAGCIALAMGGHGLEVSKEDIPHGIAVTVSMRPAGVKTVVDVFDVEDLGDQRSVTLYSVAGKRGEPRPLSGPAAKCV